MYIYICMYVYIYISFMNFRFDWCAHVILSCMLCASCSLVRHNGCLMLFGVDRRCFGLWVVCRQTVGQRPVTLVGHSMGRVLSLMCARFCDPCVRSGASGLKAQDVPIISGI